MMLMQQQYFLLASLLSTMTHLDMRMEGLDYSLGDVLGTFQHPASLACHDISNDTRTAPESYPKLKKLKLSGEEDGFQSTWLDNKIS